MCRGVCVCVRDSHSGIASFVDDDRFAGLIDVVIQAKIRSDSVQQHPMVGGHRRKLPLLAS